MNNTEKLIEGFRRQFGLFSSTFNHDEIVFDKVESWLVDALESVRRETEKAFGGCTKCYGKGYSTYRHGYRAEADMFQSEQLEYPIETHMIYCTCDRGKQLEKLKKEGGE